MASGDERRRRDRARLAPDLALGFSHGLDDRTRALVRLGALVATGAAPASYQRQVAEALAAGATDEEVIDTLIAVSSTVGLAHVVAASVGLALGLGYDVEAAFEGEGPFGRDDHARGAHHG